MRHNHKIYFGVVKTISMHGGNIYGKAEKIQDYSSNINPFGVPKSFEKALSKNIENFTNYPDIEYRNLKKRIAQYLETDSSFVFVGNGAVDVLYKTIQALDYKKAVIAVPTFLEYKRAMDIFHIKTKEIQYYNFEKICFDFNQFKQIEENCIYVICNPNNPTGSILKKEKMMQFSEKLKEKNSFLIVDEAFMDFVEQKEMYSVIKQLNTHTNMLVIGAATKFFGMPGIRLGYGITCNRSLLEKLQQNAEPWAVNTAAEIAGTVIFGDKKYIAKSKLWIKSERKFMMKTLSKIKGLTVFPSCVNFFLVKTDYDSHLIQQQMEQEGFLIRTPEGFTCLDNTFFRIAVKDRQNNKAFCKALKKVIQKL